VLVLCDGRTPPDWVAMDLFAQAEHDELAQAILISPDGAFLSAVATSMQRLIEQMPRRQVIAASLRGRGALITVRDLEDESFADLMVDVNLAEIDRDLEELRAIDAAMLRIADGSYGRCEHCDTKIEIERLRATPFANRCFNCQTLHERTHYQKQGHTL
jgi:RNA polymerase-binding transcription factor DksA